MWTHRATQRRQQGIEDQGDQGGGRRAEDQGREIVQVNTGENQLAVAAGANQERERRGTDVNGGGDADPDSMTGQAAGSST